MYFWNVDALVEDLKGQRVPQKDQFKYAVAFSILMVLISDQYLSEGSSYSYLDFTSTFLVGLITFVGVAFCYKKNSDADDRDFILRFICIGFPITVRFLVMVVPVAIVGGVIEGVLDPSSYDQELDIYDTSIYQVSSTVLFEAAFYVYYVSKFKRFSVK